MLIVKNTTINDIEITPTGDTIPALGQITIDPVKYAYYSKEDTLAEIDVDLSSGNIIINDGNRDLTYTQAKDYLSFRNAFGIPFLSDPERINGFEAKETQSAIEELGDLAAPLRVPIALVHNGTLSNKEWVGYSNLLPGDQTPIVAPINGNFVGFTWSNSKPGADFALTFRKNNTTASIFFTWSVDNTQTAKIDLPTPQPFLAGETIFIQYVDEGTNASDATLVLLFRS